MNIFTHCNINQMKWEDGTPCYWSFDLDNGQVEVWTPDNGFRRICGVDENANVKIDEDFAADYQVMKFMVRPIRKYVKSMVFSIRKRRVEFAEHLEHLHDCLRDIEVGNTVSIYDSFKRSYYTPSRVRKGVPDVQER